MTKANNDQTYPISMFEESPNIILIPNAKWRITEPNFTCAKAKLHFPFNPVCISAQKLIADRTMKAVKAARVNRKMNSCWTPAVTIPNTMNNPMNAKTWRTTRMQFIMITLAESHSCACLWLCREARPPRRRRPSPRREPRDDAPPGVPGRTGRCGSSAHRGGSIRQFAAERTVNSATLVDRPIAKHIKSPIV